ncbi:MAG TPA: hypothetical protein VJ832_13155, partial [Variovorax sp.]|nr:hypothetical protein [Variovorax sp.]
GQHPLRRHPAPAFTNAFAKHLVLLHGVLKPCRLNIGRCPARCKPLFKEMCAQAGAGITGARFPTHRLASSTSEPIDFFVNKSVSQMLVLDAGIIGAFELLT